MQENLDQHREIAGKKALACGVVSGAVGIAVGAASATLVVVPVIGVTAVASGTIGTMAGKMANDACNSLSGLQRNRYIIRAAVLKRLAQSAPDINDPLVQEGKSELMECYPGNVAKLFERIFLDTLDNIKRKLPDDPRDLKSPFKLE